MARTPIPDGRSEVYYDVNSSPQKESEFVTNEPATSRKLLDMSDDDNDVFEQPILMKSTSHPLDEDINSDVERAFESLQLEVTTLSERVDTLNKALSEKTLMERKRRSWGAFLMVT
jgi:hypothetical protein